MGLAPGGSAATSVEVYVDGAKSPLYGPDVTVPSTTSTLRFVGTPAAPRVRYKLEGMDTKWREQTDEMLFMIRFFNRKGDQISQENFPAIGTSPGWNGSVESSDFTERREVVTVPETAESFAVVMSSAGPAALVGVFAVSGITIRGTGPGDAPAVTYMIDSRIPNGRPRAWGKSGTHPSMATATHLEDGATGSPVLVIRDDDAKAHADWGIGVRSLAKVVPGQSLEIEWKETYSSGLSKAFAETYERLPAGRYRFAVEDLSLAGVQLGSPTRVAVNVRRPYWESLWFWAACVAATTVLTTTGGRHLVRKKINRRLRQVQLIADERLRIARDLHDDLGTRLSHISLLGAYAASHRSEQEARDSLRQITAMSRELISALSETVWMLNPNNNQLEALVDFLCRLVSELCRLAQIRCRIDAMSVTGVVPISHEFRHNVSLAVKEAVNNALRHSRATEIKLTIRLEDRLLKIAVVDNGIGMTAEPGKSGVGLQSICQRMQSIRGHCAVNPIAQGGLEIALEAPMD